MKAVIFDLGGVVFDSPIHFLADYEKEHGLPTNFIARVVGGYAIRKDGPWQQLERGDVSFGQFCQDFDREVEALGEKMSTKHMMLEMAARSRVRPEMVEAVRRIKKAGLKAAALTNNWKTSDELDGRMDDLRAEFDVFVESYKSRLRKPDPKIYELALGELALDGKDCVFLDDIGKNLKAASAFGIKTIKVVDPHSALKELEGVIGIELLRD